MARPEPCLYRTQRHAGESLTRLVLPDDCSARVGGPREGLARAGLGMLHLPVSRPLSQVTVTSTSAGAATPGSDGRVMFRFAAAVKWPKILDGTMLCLGDPALRAVRTHVHGHSTDSLSQYRGPS